MSEQWTHILRIQHDANIKTKLVTRWEDGRQKFKARATCVVAFLWRKFVFGCELTREPRSAPLTTPCWTIFTRHPRSFIRYLYKVYINIWWWCIACHELYKHRACAVYRGNIYCVNMLGLVYILLAFSTYLVQTRCDDRSTHHTTAWTPLYLIQEHFWSSNIQVIYSGSRSHNYSANRASFISQRTTMRIY